MSTKKLVPFSNLVACGYVGSRVSRIFASKKVALYFTLPLNNLDPMRVPALCRRGKNEGRNEAAGVNYSIQQKS